LRLLRFALEGRVGYGTYEDELIHPLWSLPFVGIVKTGEALPGNEVTLLAPCEPSKIVALGLNYRDHAAEFGRQVPDEPLIFLKPSTAVIGPEADIVYPAMSRRLD
jgi:2-keto-4-pentenoate hydratase/2-oxohepta-3-ene-1,7-dioic acid hydratase in catechol pathway